MVFRLHQRDICFSVSKYVTIYDNECTVCQRREKDHLDNMCSFEHTRLEGRRFNIIENKMLKKVTINHATFLEVERAEEKSSTRLSSSLV